MFENYRIKNLEQEADINIRVVFDNPRMDMSDEKKLIEDMKIKYASLKERFKHDKKKILEVAIDWRDYTEGFSSNETLREVATFADATDEDFQKHNEIVARMNEIQKRFDKLLKE